MIHQRRTYQTPTRSTCLRQPHPVPEKWPIQPTQDGPLPEETIREEILPPNPNRQSTTYRMLQVRKERTYEEGLQIWSETEMEHLQQEGQECQVAHHLQRGNQTPQEDDQRGTGRRETNQGIQHYRFPAVPQGCNGANPRHS